MDGQVCNYSHDDLGRIASANCGAPWSQSFSYDPFGNITKSGSGNFNSPGYDQTTNRFISPPNPFGFYPTYDANGNLTWDTVHSYSWDADGRMSCVDGIAITYDALGREVEQAAGGNCSTTGTSYKQIVYGPGGDKLALMNGQTLNKAFVPLPGGDTAVYTSSGLAYYRHADWLGSSRLDSTPARSMFSATAYAPFGENYDGSGTTDLSFTGQNQDTVPGLYDFMFREYSPSEGRFVSPDPLGTGAVSMTDPQSWNRYAYVGNTPLNATDPLGLLRHLVCDAEGNCFIVGGGDDGLFNGGAFGGAGGNYGGGAPFQFSPITAPTSQLADWEQQSVLRYLSGVPWLKISGNHVLINIGHTLIYAADGKSIIDRVYWWDAEVIGSAQQGGFATTTGGGVTPIHVGCQTCHVQNFVPLLSCDVQKCTPEQKAEWCATGKETADGMLKWTGQKHTGPLAWAGLGFLALKVEALGTPLAVVAEGQAMAAYTANYFDDICGK
jgi:RHS repeat-associated protein